MRLKSVGRSSNILNKRKVEHIFKRSLKLSSSDKYYEMANVEEIILVPKECIEDKHLLVGTRLKKQLENNKFLYGL